ncbi:hypothetical protein HanPI659440_Chr11g0418881 [Helianthus annuus]|nr:hypothetical protein HanPI659440_Chr11g0418881 [Helianthus annuus]
MTFVKIGRLMRTRKMEDEIEIEGINPEQPQKQMGPPADPLLNHPYLEFPPESDAAIRCDKLRNMHVGAHFAVSSKTLWELATEDWAREFVPRDSPWDRLFELAFTPSYREILIEFLSSFEFHPRRPD